VGAVKCLLCAGPLGRVRFERAGHAVRDCTACGLVQLDPLPGPDATRHLYEDEYFGGAGAGYTDYAAQETEYLATFDEELDRIARFVAAGTLLDVGCGFGWFVRQALARGYDAHGVDVSAHAVAVASRSLAGRIHAGTPDTVPALADLRFDVIFGSHVIEHVTDPRRFVADLVTRLRPGGVIALVTPDVTSGLARLSGRRWVSYKIPEHVAYYSPVTMRRLLESEGLRVRAIEPAHQHYALPFVADRVRALIRPLDRLVPRVEHLPGLRDRRIRIPTGSLRAIARAPGAGVE
jgi:SAM-dependent methyltransferase